MIAQRQVFSQQLVTVCYYLPDQYRNWRFSYESALSDLSLILRQVYECVAYRLVVDAAGSKME